jgi:hypothetical protein
LSPLFEGNWDCYTFENSYLELLYLIFDAILTLSVISATKTILERLGFSDAAAAYLTRDCGIESLKDIAYLDGDDDVENTIKGVASTGGTVTFGT